MALKPNKFKGGVEIENENSLDLKENSSNGSNKISLKAPASLSGDVSFTLPNADGASNQVIQTNGSGILSFATPNATKNLASISSATTLAATNQVILCDASSAAFTVTLPAAASNSGQVYEIKKTDSTLNAVTIDGNASETVGGSATTTLNTEGESITIICDGSNWQIVRRDIPSIRNTYTMTITGTTTNPAKNGTPTIDVASWSRRGNKMVIHYNYRHTAAGSTGSGTYLFSVPSGITIANPAPSTGFAFPALGSASGFDGGAEIQTGLVTAYNSTNLAVFVGSSSVSNGYIGSTKIPLGTTTVVISFVAEFYVSGWNG